MSTAKQRASLRRVPQNKTSTKQAQLPLQLVCLRKGNMYVPSSLAARLAHPQAYVHCTRCSPLLTHLLVATTTEWLAQEVCTLSVTSRPWNTLLA